MEGASCCALGLHRVGADFAIADGWIDRRSTIELDGPSKRMRVAGVDVELDFQSAGVGHVDADPSSLTYLPNSPEYGLSTVTVDAGFIPAVRTTVQSLYDYCVYISGHHELNACTRKFLNESILDVQFEDCFEKFRPDSVNKDSLVSALSVLLACLRELCRCYRYNVPSTQSKFLQSMLYTLDMFMSELM